MVITGCLVDVIAVMSDVFSLVCNFHVPLALKVGCPSSGSGCDIALVFIFLCVGLMASFVVLRLTPVFFPAGGVFAYSDVTVCGFKPHLGPKPRL
jgi:hypothetical protein